MHILINAFALLSLLLAAALFGFFYAWVCSTMWGLDAADPRTAIAAMQAMNASVRNAVFAPAFFGTAPVALITAVLLWSGGQKVPALCFAIATVIIFFGAFVLTIAVNVPMNETLAQIDVPQDIDAARAIWADYSAPWQFWNQIRTIASGLGVLCIGIGLMKL